MGELNFVEEELRDVVKYYTIDAVKATSGH